MRAFRVLGHEPIEASNLPDAVSLFESNRPALDLVWLDLNFDADAQDKTGVRFARQIRATDPHMPIILLSGRVDTLSADERLLFDTIAQKPLGVSDIEGALNKVLVQDPVAAAPGLSCTMPGGAA